MMKTCVCKGIVFDKYLIDYDTGNIYRKGKDIPLKKFDNGVGYDLVDLMANDNTPIRCKTHFISAHTFLGEQPPNTIINHKDGNKKNCAGWNLEYLSHRGNVEHAQRLIKGKEYYALKVWGVVDKLRDKGYSIAQISRELNIPYYVIRDRLYGKTYQFRDM